MSLLLHGDCLEHMKTLTDDSIDLIFCDLPYGVTSCKWDCLVDLDEFWKQIMRIKKLNTPIFFTCTTKFGVSLINSAPKKLKFFDLVWVKSAPTGHLLAKKFPMRKHEMIYVFYEKLPFYDLSSHKHKFIKEEPQHKWVKGATDIYGGAPTEDSKECGGHERRYEPPLPNSMLEIKSTKGKHSTEKPVALMSWILKYYSKEGDVVLDPTMGSGSTGVACKDMKRNFIGIEMDDDIFEVAYKRLNEDECV